MKRTLKILFAVLAVTLVFGMTACGDKPGNDNITPPAATVGSATYSGIDESSGTSYILTVTETEGRSARYAAQTGDYYVLRIIVLTSGEVKISKGTVLVGGEDLKLQPETSDAQPFTVTVVTGEGIKTINGKISTSSGEVIVNNVTLKPSTPTTDSSLNGTWTYDYTWNEWVGEDNTVTHTGTDILKLNNGDWEYSYNEKGKTYPGIRGKYSLSTFGGNKYITISYTHIYANEDDSLPNGTSFAKNKWYTMDEYKSLVVNDYLKNPSTYGAYSLSEFIADLDDEVNSTDTIKYTINGNKLSLWWLYYDYDDGWGWGEPDEWTKQ